MSSITLVGVYNHHEYVNAWKKDDAAHKRDAFREYLLPTQAIGMTVKDYSLSVCRESS